MNDFTKEELENILSWADVYTEFGQSWVYQIHKPLIDKIAILIHTYCEHEWNYNQHEMPIDCAKCKKDYK